jgi:hypothetical protein
VYGYGDCSGMDGVISVHFGLRFLTWSGVHRDSAGWLSFGVAGVIEGRSHRDTTNMERFSFDFSSFLISDPEIAGHVRVNVPYPRTTPDAGYDCTPSTDRLAHSCPPLSRRQLASPPYGPRWLFPSVTSVGSDILIEARGWCQHPHLRSTPFISHPHSPPHPFKPPTTPPSSTASEYPPQSAASD